MGLMLKAYNFMADAAGTFENVLGEGYKAFKQVIEIVMPVLIGVILMFGLVYSIILGVNYAKAEDSEKREEAKKRLIGAIVGVLIAAVMVAVIWIILQSDLVKNMFK